MTELLREPLSAGDTARVGAAAKEGKIVVFPTETVYGIGTSALAPGAAAKIFELKRRDGAKPLPILLHSIEELARWANVPEHAAALARAFWPGPLTLVLEPVAQGRALLSPGAATVAFRVPDHDGTRALIAASGAPWASSSANMSGETPPADAESARRVFEDRADIVVAGAVGGGTPSTVVAAVGGPLRIVRQGALAREKIAAVAPVE